MKVLLVKPFENPQVIDIKDELEVLHELVGGYIECIAIDRGVDIVCNDEGKLMGLPLNRPLYINNKIVDFISGDFFIVGVRGCEFESLSDAMIKKWTETYRIY